VTQRKANPNQNHADSVGRVYAEALLEMAETAGQLSEIGDELKQLDELLEAHPELSDLLSNRIISTREREASIDAIFKGRVSDLMYHFLLVVNNKNRFDTLPSIVRAFTLISDERSGVIEADAFVAREMSQEQVVAVCDRVSQAVGRNVVLHQHIDPKLIGGLKIRVGDRLIDGSLTTQLRLIRNALIETGRESVRADMGVLIHE